MVTLLMDNPKPGKLCSTAMVVGQANNRFFFPSPYSMMGENLSTYLHGILPVGGPKIIISYAVCTPL